MPEMTEAGRQIIKDSEGLRLDPYDDGGGVWTIGYGHTAGVTANSPEITEDEADDLLDGDVIKFAHIVSNFVTVSLTNNQFSALVSLTFNLGSAPLHKTLGTKLNAGDYAGAADEFGKWIYQNGKILPGLVTRRAKEKALFNS